MLRTWLHLVVGSAIFIAPVGAALFRVWVHSDVVQTGYRLSEAEKQRTDLRRVKRQLEVELAAEKSPERLTLLANKLGLGPLHASAPVTATKPNTKSIGKAASKSVVKASASKGKRP